VVGVEVTNRGRAPFHVMRWALRADPSKISAVPIADQLAGPTPQCDIGPGATATLVTGLANARSLAAGGQAVDSKQQRIRFTVSSGGHTFRSKRIHPALLRLGS
jgi:hypothetical protein